MDVRHTRRYSDVNCDASGVLSGMVDIGGVLNYYASSTFGVRVVRGVYEVTIRGVSSAEMRGDYASATINDRFFRDVLYSYLIFTTLAVGAAMLEGCQLREMGRVLDAVPIKKVPAFAAAIEENRWKPGYDPAAGASKAGPFNYKDFCDDAILAWDAAAEGFERRGAELAAIYETRILQVSGVGVTKEYLGGLWLDARLPAKDAGFVWNGQCGSKLQEIKEAIAAVLKPGNEEVVCGKSGYSAAFTVRRRDPSSRDPKDRKRYDPKVEAARPQWDGPRPAAKRHRAPEEFEVGADVDAFFKFSKEWYRGKVDKVIHCSKGRGYGSNQYEVLWPDGSSDKFAHGRLRAHEAGTPDG